MTTPSSTSIATSTADDIIGVAVQIHLPTTGALTDLIKTGLAVGGLFAPGLEQGFIPVEDP